MVVPVFNEQEVIAETHRRLSDACVAAAGDNYEIVYVDDGSRDRTWLMLNELATRDCHVVAVGLSRNFGHQLTLSAGLELCRGERILMIDADLQDPPELVLQMMQKSTMALTSFMVSAPNAWARLRSNVAPQQHFIGCLTD